MLKIYAHRGNQAQAVENSLTAFQDAVTAGADGIECDLHLTADGALVVIHDEQLDRTTDSQGEISDLSLAQIQAARLRFPDGRVTPDRVPSLPELLNLLRDLDFKGTLNLELKTDQKDYAGIEAAVLAAVEELAPDFDIVYSSFNWYTLQRLKALAPGAKIAALVEESLLPYLSHLPGLEPTAIHLDRQLYQDEDLRARFKQWPIRLWTVNDPADWAHYASLSQDGHLEAIMTDTPAAALVVRDQGEACHD
jgi:hypothetical protein